MIDLRGRTFVRDSTAGLITTRAGILPIHAETSPGSGVFTQAIDLTPDRITTGGNDGWRIVSNGWHFALGQPAGRSGDGWIGFGGRGGQNWMFSRLQGVGYLHGPTRTWRDLGGAPTYSRANLTSGLNKPFQFGGETFTRKASVNWNDLWPSLPQGQIDLQLSILGHGIKEFIRIDQPARSWIAANRPPLTPLNETWFGFLWEMDWSDVPRLYRGGVQVGSGEDFDDALPLEMRDALDRLLGIFPVGHCWVEGIRKADLIAGTFRENQISARVIKRFWAEGGSARFFVGVRADVLAQMAPGTLVIDPPQVTDTATGTDDRCGHTDGTVHTDSTGHGNLNFIYNRDGSGECPCYRFDMTAMTAGTVTAATVSRDWGNDNANASNTYNWHWRARDIANAPALGADPNNGWGWDDTTDGTTATVAQTQVNNPTSGAAFTSASLVPIIQELVDSYGDTIQNLALAELDDESNASFYLSVYDSSAAAEADPSISVTQNAGDGGGGVAFRFSLLRAGR